MSQKYSEADLCKEFAAWISTHRWTAYPETGGSDLRLVAGENPERLVSPRHVFIAQDQVGVQAKLVGNLQVLAQALDLTGFRAVLVGRASIDFMTVAKTLQICVFAKEKCVKIYGRKKWMSSPTSPFHTIGYVYDGGGQRFYPLPPVVPDLPAGGKSPRQLTEWRLKAFKLVKKLLDDDAVVTNATFTELGIFRPRWLKNGWVAILDTKPVRYASGVHIMDVMEGYEAVYKQLDEGGHLD